MNLLREKGLYDDCAPLKSRSATEEELKLCHAPAYIDSLTKLNSKSNEELIQLSQNRDSVYYHKETLKFAKLATGCLLSVLDGVCSIKVDQISYRFSLLSTVTISSNLSFYR